MATKMEELEMRRSILRTSYEVEADPAKRACILTELEAVRQAVGRELVAAIRADKLVGRGSCTSVDECWTDEDLTEYLARDDVTTVEGAVRWARESEGLWLEKAADARWGEDDDPELEELRSFRRRMKEEDGLG